MHKIWNEKGEAILIRQAKPCICGARRSSIKQMTSIDGTEMGVICLKCERFALGMTLTESIEAWNKRHEG